MTVDFKNTANATGYREYYFKTTLDDFTQLTMKGLASAFSTLGNVNYAVATVYFQNSGAGKQFVLIDTATSRQRHFASVVINLSGGALASTGIVGDNFCDGSCFCYSEECYETSPTGYGSTDGVFYISWAGDDSNGKSLLSSAMRLSRFSLYSVSSVYSSVRSSLGY